MGEWDSREHHIQMFMDALTLLASHGEVWFFPGNNGDLGSVMVGDRYVDSIRTYTERHDG